MTKKTLTLAVLALASTACLATSGEPIEDYPNPTTAVLLLDLQRDFLEDGGKMAVDRAQVEPLLATVDAVVAEARARGLPVIRVGNAFSPNDVFGNLARNNAAIRGSAGAETDPRVTAEVDAAFDKTAPDAFSVDDFDAYLRERQVNRLVILGLFADGCVYWTTQGALNRGYSVLLVREGVAAANEGDREHALKSMRADGVEVVETGADISW